MDKTTSSYNVLKQKLEERNKKIKEHLVVKHSQSFDWLMNNTKQLAAGALGGFLLLTSPSVGLISNGHEPVVKEKFLKISDNMFAVSDLEPYLPETVGSLTPNQEDQIANILSRDYDLKVTPEINGMRLNRTYGYIGAEQHLIRYPGDTIETHFDSENDALEFEKNGMAKGRGAFGYFASSKNEMTQKDKDSEKYYIAVQTFMAPEYGLKTREYVNFFKFRKMLVVNPENGKAVVADIADSGPALWTGKQLGGSPEVMDYLQRVDGAQKGGVLYFFIDDPTNSIPLGPIDAKKTESL